ncbi:helix-turn-helix domain-containing protein, partial [Salmonella enterica subsp. enterica serovar Montevideo]|nr:helix-turn-helix domain-containing protein [Salmonella enterica subsp. enterica serovar Montevideo]EJR1334526.1 helix-turn-helix domain-containing protein [Salmonella enterica subsp. enterica serovar Montevideo]
MSMNLMAKAMSIKVGNPLRKLVLIKLADNANDEGECWPSYQHIADQCEVSRSTVKSHIRALEDMGLLKREFRRKGELNQSNVFYLTLDNAQQIPPESGGAGADPRTYHSFEPVKEPLERKKKPSSMPEGFSPSAS